MATLYTIAHYKSGFILKSAYIFEFLIGLVVYVVSMLVLNLITQKNDLTQKSTHTVLLFSFLTTLIPSSLESVDVLLSNLFILIALRSILDLKIEKNIKSKVFNASLCISIASLIYFWSIGFMILVFVGVFLFESKDYRNWIIPFIGFATIYLFMNCYQLAINDTFFSITEYIAPVSFSFDDYLNNKQLFTVGTIMICTVFFFSIYLFKFKRNSAKIKPILNLIIGQLLIAIAFVCIVPNKNTAELYFIASPLAIIGTTYLELEYNELVKEVNIWVFLLLPFMILLF
ncbi:DUF6427 family protein [Aquimarina sp. 2201CG5-10]|uniref:DUF6427 family protein n=1 Tax=Aquimarina callyspongiae TaxID=3098150 RepID=UPI002AB39742|nr:DUF6427 family protein [Aquimarina sp. 2201CG5-10]MDY8138693.1 DUF6427 family protein [Aquimarina sp. 2201CG5-10]